MKHSPEPWTVTKNYQGALTDKWKDFPLSINAANGFKPAQIMGDGKLNPGTSEANAARIVACVNAMEGVADPAAEIARLRRCEAILAAIIAPYKDWDTTGLNAHAISGEITVGEVNEARAALLFV